MAMKRRWPILLCLLFIIAVIPLSSTTNLCPGDDVTFTCRTSNTLLFSWLVTDGNGTLTTCATSTAGTVVVRTCGPMDVFSVSVSGGGSTSTLSAQSVDDTVNGTRVLCGDDDVNETICVIDFASSPGILSVGISECGVCGGDGCSLTVVWSEVTVTCGGSVSGYVLTVTPPTSDCQSSPDCVLVDDSAVYTLSGNETQHIINDSGGQNLVYNMTVRAETCDGRLAGNLSETFTANLTCRCTKRVSQEFSYYYEYNLITSDIEDITVYWLQFDVLGMEAGYRVVVMSESGVETVIDIVTGDNCTGDTCSYIFSSDSITTSYSVNVTVVGCTTETFMAENISSFCSPDDLLVSGVDWSDIMLTLDGLGFFSFPGGNVTFNGVSLGSTAIYRTSVDYRVNGGLMLESVCLNNMWTPSATIVAECTPGDLLLCNNIIEPSPNVSCCDDSSICAQYSGVSINSTAQYTTSDDYCITTELVRTCTPNMEWDGQTPNASEGTLNQVSAEKLLSGWNSALIGVGLAFFFTGLSFAITVGVVLGLKIKKCGGVARCGYWIAIAFGVVFLISDVALWLAVLGYTAANNFSEGDGYLRADDSYCVSPSGKVEVRDCLIIASFVLAILVLIHWLVCLITLRWAIKTGDDCKMKNERKLQAAPNDDQELDQYDTLTHLKTSSPQPLLSDSDPAYGKLGQSGGDSPQHYGKLDHSNKKGGTLPVSIPAPDSELDRDSPQHYGKLDRGGKTSTLPPPSDSSEYGKLDRSQMKDDPQHYGKLDHGDKKGTTLPGAVVPPTAEGYGKLDRTHMQVESGAPGDMYDVVTNEPRHKPRGKTSDPSSKPRKQPGEEGSLL